MNINPIVLGLIIGVIIAVIVMLNRKDKNPDEYSYEATKPPRQDKIRFGYYLGVSSQFDQVVGHTNLWWTEDGGREGAAARLANIVRAHQAGMDVVLDVSDALWDKTTLKPEAETNLRGLLSSIRFSGALSSIKVIVIRDEINLSYLDVCGSAPQAVAICRKLIAEFGMTDCMMGAVYTSSRPFCHIDLFDVVGFDDYREKANVLRPNAMYDNMRKTLRPDQKTILLPGGYLNQSPKPWANFANDNPEVWGIVPFLWQWPSASEQQPGDSCIRDLPVRAEYEALGRKLSGKE